MTLDFECPECGESDDLSGDRLTDAIRMTCGPVAPSGKGLWRGRAKPAVDPIFRQFLWRLLRSLVGRSFRSWERGRSICVLSVTERCYGTITIIVRTHSCQLIYRQLVRNISTPERYQATRAG